MPLSGLSFLSSLSLSPWFFLLFPTRDLSWMLMWKMNYRVMPQMLESLLCHVYRFTLKQTFSYSLSLSPSPSAERSCNIKTGPPHCLTEDGTIPLTLWPLWVPICLCVGMFFFFLLRCKISQSGLYSLCNKWLFCLCAFPHLGHRVEGRKERPGGGRKSQLLFVWKTGGRALAV